MHPAIFIRSDGSIEKYTIEPFMDPHDKPMAHTYEERDGIKYRHIGVAYIGPSTDFVFVYLQQTTHAREQLARRIAQQKLKEEGLRFV